MGCLLFSLERRKGSGIVRWKTLKQQDGTVLHPSLGAEQTRETLHFDVYSFHALAPAKARARASKSLSQGNHRTVPSETGTRIEQLCLPIEFRFPGPALFSHPRNPRRAEMRISSANRLTRHKEDRRTPNALWIALTQFLVVQTHTTHTHTHARTLYKVQQRKKKREI